MRLPVYAAFGALLLASACARDTDEPPAGPPQVEYSALGQEPGWALRIDRERIVFTGSDNTRVAVARPLPVATAYGQRYVTGRIVVNIVPGRCNDVMSGRGFEDSVFVSVAGRSLQGCGGARVLEDAQ